MTTFTDNNSSALIDLTLVNDDANSELVVRRRFVASANPPDDISDVPMVPATSTGRSSSVVAAVSPPQSMRGSPEGSSDSNEARVLALSDGQPPGLLRNDRNGHVAATFGALLPRDEPPGAKEEIPLRDTGQLETTADSGNGSVDEAADSDSDSVTSKFLHTPVALSDESEWAILLQVIFPFLVAGAGMVAAGIVLDIVQHWPVFTEVPEIFILVPALLGLKGNLEMTLASRLSTLANLGKMDTREKQIKVVTSNLALIQVQATVVAFLASMFAIVLAWIPDGKLNWHHALLLCASALTTASLASLLLSVVMSAVVIASLKYRVNPDNVATPIAASLGDLTTLVVLSVFGSVFLHVKANDASLVNGLVVAAFLVSAPVWAWLAARDVTTVGVLRHGWSPVVFSMLISSGGGFILKFAVSRFHGIAVFQPVINGVGGNLVAVQASRISTSLHQTCKLGSLARGVTLCSFTNPFRSFCSNDLDSRAARVLLAIVIPGHLFFNFLIHFLGVGHTTISPLFTTIYITAAVAQVVVLLYVCQWLVRRMWASGVDPDNSAIPYLTALGDLLGTALLALSFLLLYSLGDRDADIGE